MTYDDNKKERNGTMAFVTSNYSQVVDLAHSRVNMRKIERLT